MPVVSLNNQFFFPANILFFVHAYFSFYSFTLVLTLSQALSSTQNAVDRTAKMSASGNGKQSNANCFNFIHFFVHFYSNKSARGLFYSTLLAFFPFISISVEPTRMTSKKSIRRDCKRVNHWMSSPFEWSQQFKNNKKKWRQQANSTQKMIDQPRWPQKDLI